MTAALLLFGGCSAPLAADLRGVWGGEHVGLTITDKGSSLEFDCASGTIPGAFSVNTKGYFKLLGTYTQGTGGPAPIDPPPARPTTYAGHVSGQRMSLTVDPEGDIPSSTYELQQGAEPQLLYCL